MSDPAIQSATDEQLLLELIRRNPVAQGALSRDYAGSVRETTIGIGNDNTATVLLHEADLQVLCERVGA